MSIPAIGSTAIGSVAPAAPAAADAQAPLSFMLLPLPAPAMAPPASPGLTPSPAPDADEPADDAEAPLIGWLLDSFALAAAPRQSVHAAPAAPVPALPEHESRLTVPASPQHATQQHPLQQRTARVAGITAAAVADGAAFVAPTSIDLPIEIPLRPAAPPIPNGIDMPPAEPLSNAPIALALAPGASLSQPTATPAPPTAPADGAPSPLVADAPDFGADLGERIAWQMDQGLGEATIELHPAELGALTIRIETQAQQAQVHILAAEPAARALLSQCLPQLRELLGASGMTLTRGQVESGERRADDGVGLPAMRTARRRVASVTLVDTYA